ncbi:hypothetical protein MTO96_052200 [Rhipicephalus appendiculatus]
MSCKRTWCLPGHLLDTGTAKSSPRKRLQQLLHRYRGTDAEVRCEPALRCVTPPDVPPILPPHSGEADPETAENMKKAFAKSTRPCLNSQ